MVKYLYLILYFLLLNNNSYSKTIVVGNNSPIKSINQGLILAKNGDTIMVHHGLYREGNISIQKQITLIGVNNPIIDGQKKFEPISIKSPNVTIRGFTISNSGQSSMNDIAGIKIYNTSGVKIINNTLINNFFAIYSQNSKNCLFIDNKIFASGVAEQLIGNGIHAWKSDSLQIENNIITGHRDGIYLEFVTHTSVKSNLSEKNLRYGLHFMFSHDNSYILNTFRANGAGVAVMYTKRVTMENNIFEMNWGDAAYGLLLKDITDSKISNNQFIQNTTAIFMEGSNRIQMINNTFKGNGWAAKIQANCIDNYLKDNNFFQNTFDIATNGSLALNTFENNYWDKYEGYDLNKDGIGDIPFRPVSLFSMLVERQPSIMLLFRSFIVNIFDRTEKLLPSLTPEGIQDIKPRMKSVII